MGWKQNKINYIQKFNRENYHRFFINVNVNREKEMFEWLKSKGRVATYIKQLILKDMGK